MTADMQETKRTVGRPEKLIPPIRAPFDEVLKAVGLDESGAEGGGKFDEREEAGSLHRHFPVLRKSGSRLDLALF